MTDDPPWEPPLAGTEAEHLVGALERLRATFRWKADGLDHAGLTTRIGASALTIGSLLSHLALVEDDDWSFTMAADVDAAELYALWDGAVDRSRERLATALERGGMDQRVAMS